MKVDRLRSAALAAVAALLLAGCQTAPLRPSPASPAAQPHEARGGAARAATPELPEIPSFTTYTNRHGIAFTYPQSWHVEDPTLDYADLDSAAREGGAYIQVYSYDRIMAADPTVPVPASEAKIMIVMARNTEKLDYPSVLSGLGNEIVDRGVMRIDGTTAYKVHYRILNQESGGKLDILSVLLIDQGYLIRFICYPWNSRYVSQFEKLAESFHGPRK